MAVKHAFLKILSHRRNDVSQLSCSIYVLNLKLLYQTVQSYRHNCERTSIAAKMQFIRYYHKVH